jgi:hypothetical protein
MTRRRDLQSVGPAPHSAVARTCPGFLYSSMFARTHRRWLQSLASCNAHVMWYERTAVGRTYFATLARAVPSADYRLGAGVSTNVCQLGHNTVCTLLLCCRAGTELLKSQSPSQQVCHPNSVPALFHLLWCSVGICDTTVLMAVTH